MAIHKLTVVLALGGLALHARAEGVVGYWAGSYGYYVSNVTNWYQKIRPGLFTKVCGGASTCGATGGTMICDSEHFTGWGDALVFGDNFSSISNIVFTGAQKKRHYIPGWAPAVHIEPFGKFEVQNTVDLVPRFTYNNGTVLSALKMYGVSAKGQHADIINDSTNGVLQIASLYSALPNGAKWSNNPWYLPSWRIIGRGDVEILKYATAPTHWNSSYLTQQLVLQQSGAAKLLFNTSSGFYVWNIRVPKSDCEQVIQMASAAVLNIEAVSCSKESDYNILASNDVQIVGGTVSIGLNGWESAYWHVLPGKTLTFGSKLRSAYDGGSKGFVVTGGGTVRFTAACTNLIEGVGKAEAATVEATVIGDKGSKVSNLGQGDSFCVAAAGRLKYIGVGETANRTLNVRWGSDCYLEQAGTGKLTLSGTVTPDINDIVLELVNNTAYDGELSGTVKSTASKKLGLRKTGSGVWRLSGTASYTGATAVNAGTLAIGASTALTNSAVTLAGGTLSFEGDADSDEKTLLSLALKAGTASAVHVAAGMTVTLPSLTVGVGATLNVVIGTGATLAIDGLTPGLTPDWLTINGQVAIVNESGQLVSLDAAADVTIDAKGGVVPTDAASKIVSIGTAVGSGTSVTLGATETGVMMLRQDVTTDEATVALKSGETLTARAIVVAPGAQRLTLAAEEGAATVSGLSDSAVLLEGPSFGLAGDVTLNKARLNGTMDLSVTGKPKIGTAWKIDGTVTLAGQKLIAAEGSSVSVGPDGLRGKLVVQDGTLEAEKLFGASTLKVGSGAGDGTLEVSAGTVTNHILTAGSKTDGSTTSFGEGALLVKGGQVYNSIPCVKYQFTGTLGGSGSTYFSLSGGSYREGAWATWGSSPSQVVADMTGGRFSFEGAATIGNWETQASFLISGGWASCDGYLHLPFWNSSNNFSERDRISQALSIEGSGTFDATQIELGKVKAQATTDNFYADVSAVNLLTGGTLKVSRIYRSSAYLRSVSQTSRALVNFNGGTVCAKADVALFGAPEAVYKRDTSQLPGVDRVTFFEQGGTINLQGHSFTTYQPLEVPTGNSVSAIPLPAAFATLTFTAPPAIIILGDGEGAMAHPIFDAASGKVTGVKILSPGWGYTSAVARFCHKGRTDRWETTCALAAAKAGAFTLGGGGTYAVACTNRVTAIKISGEGTVLKLAVDDAFPAATTLTLNGGSLDMNGHAQTLASVRATADGGAVLNGTVDVGDVRVDFDEALAGNPAVLNADNLAFGASSRIRLDNYSTEKLEGLRRIKLFRLTGSKALSDLPVLDEAIVLPEGWSLKMRGSFVVLSLDRGMLLQVR